MQYYYYKNCKYVYHINKHYQMHKCIDVIITEVYLEI